MTLSEIKKEAQKYGLTITSSGAYYVIKLNGREISRSPKSAGLAKLTDALANVAN